MGETDIEQSMFGATGQTVIRVGLRGQVGLLLRKK